MKQPFAMPAQCSKCEAVFDMRYDLLRYNEHRLEYSTNEELQEENEDLHLCWECRGEEF